VRWAAQVRYNTQEEKDMDQVTWKEHREELINTVWTPLGRMSERAKALMREARREGAPVEKLLSRGRWIPAKVKCLANGAIYRISPDWTGPTETVPAATNAVYEDKEVTLGPQGVFTFNFSGDGKTSTMGFTFNFSGDGKTSTMGFASSCANFVGYVYVKNGIKYCRPRVQFDRQTDGTYRVRKPEAVRFLVTTTA
jgi:hypothetical protein